MLLLVALCLSLPGFAQTRILKATRASQNATARPVAPLSRTTEVRPRPMLLPVADNGVPLDVPKVALTGTLTASVQSAALASRLPSDKPLTITFHLKRQNQKEMDDLVERLYNPKDPLYQHYLTPEERIERFSPTQQDFDTVARFVQKNGLTIVDASPSRTSITATGSVGLIETMFKTEMNRYQRADKSEFFSVNSDPQVPNTVAPLLLGITGLEDASKPVPAYKRHTAKAPESLLPVSTFGKVTPSIESLMSFYGSKRYGKSARRRSGGIEKYIPAGALQTAYNVGRFVYKYSDGTPMNGKGQKVGLISFSNRDDSKIQEFIDANNSYSADAFDNWYYDFRMSLTKPTIHEITLAGYTPSTDTDTIGEYDLDIEMVMILADGVDEITAPKSNDMDMELQYFRDNATDVRQISISYGGNESAGNLNGTRSVIFEELAMQGQAVFVSSGDSGAFVDTGHHVPGSTTSVEYSASSPYVTAVGGTVLSFQNSNFANLPNGQYDSEHAWTGSGGGVSTVFSIPGYQQRYLASHIDSYHSDPNALFLTVGDTTTVTSRMKTQRSVPDVSMPATNLLAKYTGNGLSFSYSTSGGTSASAPMWAAFCALLNQGRTLNHFNAPIGFLNPALYDTASDPAKYANDFHDVTTGDNSDNTSTPGFFSAVTGYDCVTGLGSFNGKNLISDLLGILPYSPISGFTASVNGGTPLKSLTTASGVPITFTVSLNEALLSGSNPKVILYRSDGPNNLEVTRQSVAGQTSVGITVPAEAVPQKTIYYYSVAFTDDSNRISNFIGYITITVNPVAFESFTFDTTAIYAPGDSVTGRVKLTGPAPKDIVFGLSSAFRDNTKLPFPQMVTVPAGKTEGTFTLSTQGSYASDFTYTINAYYWGNDIAPGKKSADIMIVVPPTIDSFTLTPNPVNGGNTVTGSLHITKPAISHGLPITIATDPTAAAVLSAPASIVIPAGNQEGTFLLRTESPAASVSAFVVVNDGNLPGNGSLQYLTILPKPVAKFATQTTFSASPNPFINGDYAVYTVQVTSNQGKTPTGTATVQLSSGFSFDVILDANGKAIFDTTNLFVPAAVYTVTVTYKGDATHDISTSAPYTLTILPGSTVVTSSTPNPSVVTQPVTLSAHVTGVALSGNPTAAPTGTVTFKTSPQPNKPPVVLATVPVDAAGNAVFVTTALPKFDNYISADYSGDTNYRRGYSGFSLYQYVNSIFPTVTLTSSPNPSVVGQTVAVTVNVTLSAPGASALAGTINLKAGFDGAVIATKTMTASDHGAVTFLVNSLPVGTTNLVAEANLNGPLGGSGFLTQTVNPAPVTPPALSATVSLARSGGEILATVTVSNTGSTNATNVSIRAANIARVNTTTTLPATLGTVPGNGSKSVILHFPGSIGTSGTKSNINLTVSADSGGFTFGTRITLP